MHVRRVVVLFCLSVVITRLPGADNFYGPILGIIPDLPSGTIRPIRGIPGAATVGPAVSVGENASIMAVSPRQTVAVTTSGSGTLIASLSQDGPLSNAESGLPPGFVPTALAFSPSGSAIAFYDRAARNIWVKRDTLHTVDITRLGNPVQLLAVSDRSDPLIAGTVRGDAHTVFLLDNSNYRLVSGFEEVSDVAFIGATGDVAIADQGARKVLVIHDGFSGSAPMPALDLSSTVDAPIHISGSADGRLLAVLSISGLEAPVMDQSFPGAARNPAVHRRRSIGVLRLSDGAWKPMECNCTPERLVPLRGNALFRLTQNIDRPVWLLDADSETPQLSFIPAVQP